MKGTPDGDDIEARRWSRAVKWVAILALGSAGIAIAADLVAERFIRKKFIELAGRVAAQVDPKASPSISVSLWDRRVSITDLRLVPFANGEGTRWQCHGTLDTLRVDGISLLDLVLKRTLHVREVRAHATDLSLTKFPIKGQVLEEASSDPRPWTVEFDAFVGHVKAVRFISSKGDSLRVADPGISISGRALRSVHDGPNGRMMPSVHDLHVEVDSIFGSCASGYSWRADRLAFDQGTKMLRSAGGRFAPQLPLEVFSAEQQVEGDVIDVHLAPFVIEGIDLDGMLMGQAPTARSVRSIGGDVLITRDKTKPDGPVINKPLLARLIRMLPAGSGIDSVHVDSLNVSYRERAVLDRGYAEIPFTGIHGRVVGLRNVLSDTAALVIAARCVVFDHAPVEIELRTTVQDTTDRFRIKAAIGAMPFTALNKATGPLVDIRATEGRLDSVIFRMSADRLRASGAVHMAYQGLKLSTGHRRHKEPMDRLQTMVLNSLVHDDYLDARGVPREGLFTIERRQDRSLPNYVWSGVREGVKAVLLPGVLTQ